MKLLRHIRILSVIAILALTLILGACGKKEESSTGSTTSQKNSEKEIESSDATSGGEFSAFTATDFDGNDVDQSIFSSKDLTVVNLWGTFCGPCIREMPELGELAADYAGSGIQIIGIPVDVSDQDTLETAQSIVAQTGADYVHLVPNKELYDIYLKNVTAVPETLFVDKTGTIVGNAIGAKGKDDWKKLIDDTYDKISKNTD
ncbi:MAG: TlpA disulfide reductase family protein [Hespellia sp.]|nr:TlpA disulfide reductase family protein [Hespellia sp.]